MIFTLAGSLQMQAQCNSQNVTVNDFYLGDANGVPLQSNSNYQIGQPVNAYLYAQFGGSSGNGYSLYLEYNVSVDGVTQPLVQNCLFDGQPIPDTGYHQISSFTWEWGKELELQNLYMDWYTNATTRVCEPRNSNAQCYGATENYLIKTPLVADFDYTSSCSSTSVQFNDQTTGGETQDYDYTWDFDGLGNSTSENPIFDFEEAGTYEVTVEVSDGLTTTERTKEIYIPETPEEPTVISTTDATCGENSGKIEFEFENNLTYTLTDSDNNSFQHNNGEFTDLSPGDYTLTVSNGECESETQVIIEDIEDNEDPVISGMPADITQDTDAESCDAVVDWTAPTADDNCSVESFTSNYTPGDTFPLGTTTVTYTLEDGAGNIVTASFD
ncbi:HYR domain-containing protein, partial [Salegentibacter sp.]|uniref:HYR domain-containing protein n=1 Tax=Salegentibacter sp. TaxID=1903072 RepID=UPI0035671591